jgi:single-strand DNA-binding protein
MFCKNRITLIGFLGQDAESRSTPNGTVFTRLSLATSMSWKEKGSNEYKTRTEWHRILCWNKLAHWAGTLQKGAYVEIEGELRYRDYTPAESAAACAWRRFMPTPSWRWTAQTDSPFLLLNQSQPTSLSTDCITGQQFYDCCPFLLQRVLLVGEKKEYFGPADAENVSICCESVSANCPPDRSTPCGPLAIQRAVSPRGRQFPDNPVYRAERGPRLYLSFLTRKLS